MGDIADMADIADIADKADMGDIADMAYKADVADIADLSGAANMADITDPADRVVRANMCCLRSFFGSRCFCSLAHTDALYHVMHYAFLVERPYGVALGMDGSAANLHRSV